MTGKLIVTLESHWSYVTDSIVYPSMSSTAYKRATHIPSVMCTVT